MAGFHLHELIAYSFRELSTHTSTDVAVCVFAIASGGLVRGTGRLGWHTHPIWWPRVKEAIDDWLEWQVKKIFRWIKWCTHTHDSTWWAVVCAWNVSMAVALWFRVPIIQPVIIGVIPASMLTCFIFACRNHGPSTLKSVRNVFNFTWSFWAPTVSYTAAAMVGAVILFL